MSRVNLKTAATRQYKLNGDAVDSIGGYNGTVYGLEIWDELLPNLNVSYHVTLNTGSQYIIIPGNSFPLVDKSLSFWCKLNVYTFGTLYLLGYAGGPYMVGLDSGNAGIVVHKDSDTFYFGSGISYQDRICFIIINFDINDEGHYTVEVFRGFPDTDDAPYSLGKQTVAFPGGQPFGYLAIGRGYASAQYYRGRIDNILHFDRVLIQKEIDFLYNNKTGTEELEGGFARSLVKGSLASNRGGLIK